MKTVTKNLGILIFLLLFTPFLESCTKDRSSESLKNKSSLSGLLTSMNIQEITKPTKAPEFELLSVTGERVSLRQYRGKVVLLSFWTTW